MQERLRYSPLGWSKKYEFTDSDLKCGCDLLDTWIDSTSKGRSNLPPDKIPWDAIRTTLAQCIYGGRIDNDFDQKLLNAFLANLFTAKSFEADFALIEDSDGKGTPIYMPDGIRLKAQISCEFYWNRRGHIFTQHSAYIFLTASETKCVPKTCKNEIFLCTDIDFDIFSRYY